MAHQPTYTDVGTRSLFKALWPGLCSVLLALCAAAQDKQEPDLSQASLLYRELYDLKKLEAELSKSTNVIMFVRMSSKKGVPATDLDVYVDSKTGRVPLKFAPDGAFLLLMSDELYQENPYVRCNQPKGTMSLDWGWYVKGIEKAATYRELVLPVEDFRKIIVTMGKHIPQMKGAVVSGMKLLFKPEDRARITIQTRKGVRELAADDKGVCLIPYDSTLARENPPVTMPGAPERIDFVFKGAP